MTEQREKTVLFLGIVLSVAVVVPLSIWVQGQMADETHDSRVNACVVEMQASELGHDPGNKVCEALSEAEKHEAAYRWAKRRGGL